MILRPTPRWNPYRTALKGVYLCSAATPPGGGVHGMCGLGAAEAALGDLGMVARTTPAAPARSRRPDGSRTLVCLVPAPCHPPVRGLVPRDRDPSAGRTGRTLHGRDRRGPQHGVVFLGLRDGVSRPATVRPRRSDQPGHRHGLGVQRLPAAQALPTAPRPRRDEHRRAERGRGDATRTPDRRCLHRGRGQRGWPRLHPGPVCRDLREAARSSQGRRDGGRRRDRQGARLPRRPGGPRGLGLQHPDHVR